MATPLQQKHENKFIIFQKNKDKIAVCFSLRYKSVASFIVRLQMVASLDWSAVPNAELPM